MVRLSALFIATIIGLALPALADEPLVIVTQLSNPLQNVSLETIKQVYLRKTLLDSNGIRWVPLNLPAPDPIRAGFSLALFKKLPKDQEQYWNEQYFQGINPPEVLASEEAIMRFVEITPGAIGYVRKSAVDDRVKILATVNIRTSR
jgi:hypothetical protein